MERMNEYHGNRKHANSSSVASLNITLANNNTNTATATATATATTAAVGSTAATPMVREQDQYMPIANIIRIMRRILPAHAKISDDAKETVQECVSEYISFVTGEANERCQREQRKTVTAEDVLWAMAKLGFDDYVEPLTLYLNRLRASTAEGGGGGGAVHDVKYAMHDVKYYDHDQNQVVVGPYHGPTGFVNLVQYQGVLDAVGGGYFRDGLDGGGGGVGSTSSLDNIGEGGSYDHYIDQYK